MNDKYLPSAIARIETVMGLIRLNDCMHIYWSVALVNGNIEGRETIAELAIDPKEQNHAMLELYRVSKKSLLLCLWLLRIDTTSKACVRSRLLHRRDKW
jgi:hypothetical protein